MIYCPRGGSSFCAQNLYEIGQLLVIEDLALLKVETIQAEDNFSSKKFADLAAGRPLASSSTHKRRRKDRDAVHDALLQALMDGVGSTHDKLMGLEAIDSKSGLF